MNFSKVYRGYVIEQKNDGMWYIHNCPSWTNTNAISAGPHGNWTIATHQVDKLIEYLHREENSSKHYKEENYQYSYTTENNSKFTIGDYFIIFLIVFGILDFIFIYFDR